MLSFYALLAGVVSPASAFCGTYVGDAGATLTNSSSEIVAVRQGSRTSLTLVNDYAGSLQEFAVIVPVPSGLGEQDVEVVDYAHVQAVADYSAPRLVSYTCEDFGGWAPPEQEAALRLSSPALMPLATLAGCADYDIADNEGFSGAGADDSVTVEAVFAAGEYALTVISAESATGLMDWLDAEGFTLGDASFEMLSEYVDAGSSFLAAKVNLEALEDSTSLRPLRISYESEVFSLPIRLGTLNSPGEQDLLLYVITDMPGLGEGAGGRVAVANYPEATPDDECMLRDGDDGFGAHYEEKLAASIEAAGGAAWVSEYGWAVQPSAAHCDPCTVEVPPDGPLTMDTLQTLGFESDVFGDSGFAWGGPSYYVSRVHLRYRAELVDQDLLLYETGDGENTQIRYIVHDTNLESELPVCGEGFIEGGGYCRFTPRPSPLTGVVWAACSSAPRGQGTALFGALALAVALLRRRRSGA